MFDTEGVTSRTIENRRITRIEKGKIYFEAETVSPKRGGIKWRGTVEGDSIEVSYHWSKKGWLSNTEKDYLFQGTLKK